MSLDINHKYTRELVALRRSKVLDLMAQSVPQHEIAKQLGVSHSTISLDQQWIRCTAKENIKNHIEERIPAQFEECQAGLKLLLRKAYHIVNTSTRPQEVISAMSIAVDIYGKLMDLNTNGAILEKTTKWLADKKKEKENSQNNKEPEPIEQEQEQEPIGDCESIEQELQEE